MKPSPKILIGHKNSSFLARCHHTLIMSMSNNSTACDLNLHLKTMQCPFHVREFGRIMHGSQQVFGLLSSSFGQSSSIGLSTTRTTKRGVSAIAGIDFKFKSRDFSSSVETCENINGKMVYLKDGMNVKPTAEERVDNDEDSVGGEEVSGLEADEKNNKSENEQEGEKVEEEETEVEKEAWSLLQEALVTYCDNPVGTVAANDSDDQQPLNYDQVFIRDFIPSALAFLLKGEKEIVKNFLLYTLQLQVIYIHAVYQGFSLKVLHNTV